MASLLDVWRSGTGVASQVIGQLAEEKKYVQEVDSFDASMQFGDMTTDLLKVRETVYDDNDINYQDNPDYPREFTEYYTKKIAEWRKAQDEKHPGSRYFTESLNRIEDQGTAAFKKLSVEAEVAFARQRVNTTYLNERTAIKNNPNLGVDEKLKLLRDLADKTQGPGRWDRATYEKYRQEDLAWSLEQELAFTPEEGKTTAAIRDRYDDLEKDALKPGNPEAGEEAGLYSTLPNAREAIAIAREAAVASQEAFNYRKLDILETAYETAKTNYATAVQSGDPARVGAAYREMMGAYYAGKPLRDAALGKDAAQYNPDNRVQIMRMFADPPGLAKEKPKELSQTDLIENLVQQFISGFNDPEFSMDATGQLTGFTTEDGTYYTGLSYEAIYQGLDQYAQKNGVTSTQLYYEFDKKLLERINSAAETSEAKRIINQLISFSASQWEDITKNTGREKDDIQQQMMGQVLDAYARYSNSRDPSPQKNEMLEQALKGIRDQYIGKRLQFLYDNKETSEATYTRNALGTLGDLGKALDAYHNNPDINLPGRSGGRNIPAHLDDNFRAYTNRAEAMAREELGAVSTTVEGGDVIATARNGERYRIGGSSNGDIYLYKSGGKDGWTPVAKRRTNKEENSEWVITNENGEVETIPNQVYSGTIPFQLRSGPRKLTPDLPGPKRFEGL